MAASRSLVVGGSLRRGIKVDWGAVIVLAAASGADGVEIGKAEFVKAGKAAGRVVESGEVEDVGVPACRSGHCLNNIVNIDREIKASYPALLMECFT